MTAPAFCTISGRLLAATGDALAGRLIRARVLDEPASFGDAIIVAESFETRTASDGSWSVTVPQTATVLFEIPTANINHAGLVPAVSSVTFENLIESLRSIDDEPVVRRPRFGRQDERLLGIL